MNEEQVTLTLTCEEAERVLFALAFQAENGSVPRVSSKLVALGRKLSADLGKPFFMGSHTGWFDQLWSLIKKPRTPLNPWRKQGSGQRQPSRWSGGARKGASRNRTQTHPQSPRWS